MRLGLENLQKPLTVGQLQLFLTSAFFLSLLKWRLGLLFLEGNLELRSLFRIRPIFLTLLSIAAYRFRHDCPRPR